MKKKINMRLLCITLLAVVATTVGITLIYYNIFRQQVQADLKINAELLADTGIFEQMDSVPDNSQFEDIVNDSLRLTWINSDGTVLYDNDTDASAMENHMNRPEVKDAFEKGSGESVRKSDTLNMSTFYYALRLENGTVIRVATEAKNIISVILSAFPLILGIIVVIMLICYWITRVLTRQLLGPIEEMAEHLDDPVPVAAYEELVPFANKIQSQHENILAAVKSRQDFTANVSHELKTPLTAISGYAELISMSMQMELSRDMQSELSEDGENGYLSENQKATVDQTLHFSTQIQKNAERLLSLINDIIRLSELDHSEIQRNYVEVDLYDVVQETLNSLKVNAAKKDIYIRFNGQHFNILGDRDQVKELIINLGQNAIQYNNPHGNVWISTYVKGPQKILEVKDDGIGIPKDQQDHIFERFYRVDKSRSRETGGTGLGLAIVKHIVDIHNARIEIESDVGKGTIMRVVF